MRTYVSLYGCFFLSAVILRNRFEQKFNDKHELAVCRAYDSHRCLKGQGHGGLKGQGHGGLDIIVLQATTLISSIIVAVVFYRCLMDLLVLVMYVFGL